MSARVPDTPPKPAAPILTIGEHIDASLEVISYCSTGMHQHVLDLPALAAQLGADTQMDYYFALARKCPECEAPGGGLKIGQKATD